MKDNIKN